MERYWNFHKQKDILRTFVLPKKPIKVGIWLPAGTCCCIKKAEVAGLLNQSEKLYLVESDSDEYQKMVNNAPRITSIQPFFGPLEKLQLDKKVDYAYLDYMGGVNGPIAKWMVDTLNPNIAEDATIAITQMFAVRSNKMVISQASLLLEKEGVLIREIYGNQRKDTQCMLLLIHRIFGDWDFDMEPDDNGEIPKYQDTANSMLVFKMYGFKKSQKRLFRPIEFAS